MAKLGGISINNQNVDFIIERGFNSYGYYTIGKSGGKECGGNRSTAGTTEVITLPITFKDTSYTFVTSEGTTSSQTNSDGDGDGVDYGLFWFNKTVNSVKCSKASGRSIGFYACGG